MAESIGLLNEKWIHISNDLIEYIKLFDYLIINKLLNKLSLEIEELTNN